MHTHTHTYIYIYISGKAILETAHDIVSWINWFCDMIQTYAFCKHGVEQITDHLCTHSLYCSTCCHAPLYFSLVTSAHLLNRSEVLHIYIVCSFYHTRIMSIIVNSSTVMLLNHSFSTVQYTCSHLPFIGYICKFYFISCAPTKAAFNLRDLNEKCNACDLYQPVKYTIPHWQILSKTLLPFLSHPNC
jgi:hypothetical protein